MRIFFLNSIFYRSCREESRIYYGVGTLFLHLSAKIAKLNEHRFVLKMSWFNSQCSCNFISWNSNFKLKARISSASQVKLNIHRSINLSLWTYINLLTQQLFSIANASWKFAGKIRTIDASIHISDILSAFSKHRCQAMVLVLNLDYVQGRRQICFAKTKFKLRYTTSSMYLFFRMFSFFSLFCNIF